MLLALSWATRAAQPAEAGAGESDALKVPPTKENDTLKVPSEIARTPWRDEAVARDEEAAASVFDFARLHLGVSLVGDLLSKQLGGEVAASFGFNPWFDAGASLVIGSAVGARLVAQVHPVRDGRTLLPFAQARVALHPVAGGFAFGGGLGLGLSLEAWRGRAFAQGSVELLRAPPTYLPWAALISVGYEFDFFRTSRAPARAPSKALVREEAPVPKPVEPAEAYIHGQVSDLDDQPLNATVRLPSAPGAIGQRAWDASPEFALRVPPGEYLVEVEAPGYLVRGRKVSIKQGQTLILDVQLRKVPEQRGAVLTPTEVEINQSVQFALNEAKLLPESFPILDEVADVLLRNPGVTKVRIEGHTDQTGTPERNDALSTARALAVQTYLIEKGVAQDRLSAVGLGFRHPIASDATELGRAKNRRVQFMVLERK
jgi:outer membrane protein OmpA-like peptidoglycan-associated protein